ncbi:MAG: O-antigen ligase family protein [Vicinamibacteria bacterium]
MIRLTALYLFGFGLAAYAWRDWFKALCGLILMMAVIQHPDMPKSLFGIQGLNLWNVVLLSVVLAWLRARKDEGLRWDLSRAVTVTFLLYMSVVVVSFLRLLPQRHLLPDDYNLSSIVSEYFINCLKWVVPGVLLFDGCRSRDRFNWAVACTLGVYVLLAIQVIKWMPIDYALSGDQLEARSGKILTREVGYHRVNLSMMLAGASWALFSARTLLRGFWPVLGVAALSGMALFAQSLTAGRTGYATWAVVGLLLCGLRWRRYLLLAPVAAFVIVMAVPGAFERFTQGFGKADELQGEAAVDQYAVTSGRNLIWPYVIAKIGERPLVGYGRLAMKTTGLQAFLWDEMREAFPHPHNAYLELLLDNGWLGALLVLPFYLVVLKMSFSLFMDSRSPVFVAAGGMTLALVLALLTAALGSQTFYPREGSVGMWCAIGLLFRVDRERARALAFQRETVEPPAARRRAPRPLHGVAARPEPKPAPAPVLDDLLWARAS